LLLNTGAPILTVQAILGHKFLNATLGYAHLCEGTVATDHYRAMREIERQLDLTQAASSPAATPSHLLALVDALQAGALNDGQGETVRTLRAAILTLSKQRMEKPI
jgi:hypothetical protein